VSWLMLHGFTGSPASFARLELPRFAVAPTLGGHVAEPASADFWAEVERLAALAPAATELFGYSLGSRLSLGLLARYPERFDHAVLVSAHPGLRTDAERAMRRSDDDRFVRLLRERGLVEFVSAWEEQPLWQTQRALPDSARAARHRERLDPYGRRACSLAVERGLGQMPDLRASLAQSDCSVDFLAGAQDTKFLARPRALQHHAARSTQGR
jgi:2-succinyl-6-hydroxy-2,4-cyclohexadiene-1-carboxylate synthase